MGVPLNTNGKRRSYADVKRRKPKNNNNDPFRIFFYLVLIVAGVWVYFNQDVVKSQVAGQIMPTSAANTTAVPGQVGADGTPAAGGESGGGGDTVSMAHDAYMAGNLDRAIELYREASQESQDPEHYFQVARLLLFKSALQVGSERDATLREALDAASNAELAGLEQPHGYAISGKILDWQGKPEQGQNKVNTALTYDEDFAYAHSYWAEILADLERYEQALNQIQVAIDLAPENPDVRRDYAYILEQQGDYQGAIDQYELAVEAHPNLGYLRIGLARNYRAIQDCDAALGHLFDAETFSTDYTVIYYELGFTYEFCEGNLAEAAQYYQQATEQSPDYQAAWTRLGTVRYRSGDYPGAIEAFTQAEELGEDGLVFNYQLGIAYAQEQQCNLATPYLNQAQELVAPEQEAQQDAINLGFELCATTPEPTIAPTEEAEE